MKYKIKCNYLSFQLQTRGTYQYHHDLPQLHQQLSSWYSGQPLIKSLKTKYLNYLMYIVITCSFTCNHLCYRVLFYMYLSIWLWNSEMVNQSHISELHQTQKYTCFKWPFYYYLSPNLKPSKSSFCVRALYMFLTSCCNEK